MSFKLTQRKARGRVRLGGTCLVLVSLLGAVPSPAVVPVAAPGDSVAATRPAEMRKDLRVRAWWQVMGWGVTLLVAFLFAAIAIVVFSRRFLGLMTRDKPPPTPSDDIWSMHKPPADIDADDS